MIGSILRKTIGLTLAAAFTASVAGCDRAITATTAEGDPREAPAVTRVETVRPSRQTVRRSVEEPGQVEAFEVTSVYANVVGYVRSWDVNIGAKVKKGQVMAELALPEVEAEAELKRAMVKQAEAQRDQSRAAVRVAEADVVSAQARVAAARAGIKRAEADLARWKSEYDRVGQLFRERAQTGSLHDETRNKLSSAEAARDEIDAQVKTAEASLTQSRAGLDKARSDLAAAESGIAVARSDVRRVEALLGYAKIVAPYDAVVTRRNVDTGHLTMAGAQGEPLFVVARSDVVTVTVGVPEMYAAAVDPGDPAVIRLQAVPGRAFEGKVSRTAYSLDTRSRTLRTEIDLPNPDGTLHPGLYAYVSLAVDERKDVLTVPSTAVGREGAKAFCVAVLGGKAVRLPVEVGLSDGTKTEILSGLGGDEAVVKTYAPSLTDGQPVEAAGPANVPTAAARP